MEEFFNSTIRQDDLLTGGRKAALQTTLSYQQQGPLGQDFCGKIYEEIQRKPAPFSVQHYEGIQMIAEVFRRAQLPLKRSGRAYSL